MAELEKQNKPNASIPFYKSPLAWKGVLITIFANIICRCLFNREWVMSAVLLLIIFLIAHPKVSWKKILIGSGFIAMAICLWLFVPEKTDGQWRPATLAETIAPSMPESPSSDNAAILYETLFASRNWKDIYDRLEQADPNSTTLNSLWKPQDNPQLSQLLDDLTSDLQSLQEAAHKNIYYLVTLNTIENELAISKQCYTFMLWAKLLSASANRDAGNGNIEKGIQTYISVLKINKQLKQVPALKVFLTGGGAQNKAICGLLLIAQGDKTDLLQIKQIKTILSENTKDIILSAKLIDSEKSSQKDMYSRVYLTNNTGQHRVNPVIKIGSGKKFDIPTWQQMSPYNNGLQSRLGILLGLWEPQPESSTVYQLIDSCFTPLYNIHNMKNPDDIDKQIRSVETKWYLSDTLDAIEDQTITTHRTLQHIIKAGKRSEALKKGAILACFCREYKLQHGQWPATLKEALPDEQNMRIDPCNGKDFLYKVEKDGFILYSAGINGIDENGEYETQGDINEALKSKQPKTYYKASELKYDDLMIWPPKQNKKKIDMSFLLE